MEKIKLTKNHKVPDGYYVAETKEYEPTELVHCSLEVDGEPIVAFQANYIIKGINI
jgi:hypothetical protein